jgi:tetratricopeptide (TPR) repeat protein
LIAHLTRSGTKRQTFWYCVCLALAVLALYWPLTRYGFVNFDDDEYVTANPHVLGGPTANAIKWAFTTGHASNWHPVTWLSHMLDCQLFGAGNAGAMHLVNVLFHTANSVLIFLLLRRATGSEYRSLCAAALFAFHPLHVESVAWIAERKDVLSTLFWILATWYYVSYAITSRRLNYWCALLFFAIGLMAKPMLVTLPAMFLLLDYWPLKRFSTQKLNSLVIEKLPFFFLALASSVVTFLVQKQVAIVKLDQLSLLLRIANATTTYIAYLGKTFWPAKLVFFYPHPITHSSYEVILSALALVVITAGVWLLRHRSPYLLFGWFWYLGTLVPVIGLVQVGSQEMADRYTYVPLIGIFVGLVWGLSDCFDRLAAGRMYAAPVAAFALVSCAIVTANQIRYWKDSVTLFEHALAFTRKNLVANINIGAAYMLQGRNTEALQHYLAALQIKPDNAKAQYNLGVALASLGRTDEAVKHYRIALLIDPSYTKSLKALGDSLLARGNISEALMHYKSVLQIDPNNSAVHLVLGNTLLGAGDTPGGIEHLREVTNVQPSNFEAHLNLASALASEGKLEEAIANYQTALRLDPNSALAHYQFGSALLNARREKEALRELHEALRLSPESALTLDKLGWILSTSSDASLRNGKEAIALAERACQLTKNSNPITLSTLSAAYAEDGQFERAIAIAEKSKSLVDALKKPKLFDLIKRQLSFYADHRPFRNGS